MLRTKSHGTSTHTERAPGTSKIEDDCVKFDRNRVHTFYETTATFFYYLLLKNHSETRSVGAVQ